MPDDVQSPSPPESPRFLRRVALIGDVHGEALALAAVLDFLEQEEPLDAILCTGDLPGKKGMGDMERCCALLRDAGVWTIRGNHDRWQIENAGVAASLGLPETMNREARCFLMNLPRTLEFGTPRGPLLLCHGMGRDDMAGVYPGGEDGDIARALETFGLDHYAYIVAGHTHQRMLRPVGFATIINPGTLYWQENPGFLTADLDAGTVRRFDLNLFTSEITERVA